VQLGCSTGEEHRLREFEKRVLRRIFGPQRDRVRREWENTK